ncbi:multidrug resistance-associated protein 1-like protein [Aphelenchoides avenae]|nr:multidrug resistance-associated protein 1-like protein [Aphelenchus avenae]
MPLLGARKTLEADDLFLLNDGSNSEQLNALWDRYWTPTLETYNAKMKGILAEGTSTKLLNANGTASNGAKHKKRPTDAKKVPPPSVFVNIFKMFKFELVTVAIIKALADVLQFANPFLLKKLINFISDPSAHLGQGISYALLMFACSELRSFMINYNQYVMFRIGIKVQTVLTGAIYKKSLRLSNTARRNRTIGEIVNLMAIDVERFQGISSYVHEYWSSPLQVVLALAYLYTVLGVAALPGVFVMASVIPLTVFSSIFTKRWQLQQMRLKDERLKMCSEILNGIKVIKLYAWEVPMMETIERIRKSELGMMLKSGLVTGALDAFNFSTAFLVAMFSFMTFTLMDPSKNLLTPEIAFVSVTLFNQLRGPMRMIAMLIRATIQLMVSNKRMKEFLVADEIDFGAVERDAQDKESTSVILAKNATFSWETNEGTDDDDSTATSPIIQNLSLEVHRSSFVAIAGRVGSGKSSLLSALLGEMDKLSGFVSVRGSVAYVKQQAWIQNATLRDNITFGAPYNQQLYEKVIDSCALRPDLEILPHGDATEIGEKGINLSGGQKARVSLARAVYQNSDIYLLDDPLSAVDSHVGKHIIEKLLGPHGLLRNKTRILVTHNTSVLEQAEQVLLLEDGTIVSSGPYAELISNDKKFQQFIEEGKAAETHSSSSVENDETKSVSDVVGEFCADSAVVSCHFSEYEDVDVPLADEGDVVGSTPDFSRQTSTISVLACRSTRRTSSRLKNRQSRSVESIADVRQSPKSIAESEMAKTDRKLIKKEKVETGRVKLNVYQRYAKSDSYTFALSFLTLFVGFNAVMMGRNMWLSQWSDENAELAMQPNATHASLGDRLGVFAALGFLESACYYAGIMTLLLGGQLASKNLHTPVLERILHAPMSFFDTTPLGRILNRFGKDIDVVDSTLPQNFRFVTLCLCRIIFALLVNVITTPIFGAIVVPLAVVYFLALKFYVPTSRQLKRLESVNRSPIYSHFAESIQGASTIRAFGKAHEFALTSETRVDHFIRVKYHSVVAGRWLAIRLEFVGNCVVLFAALFAVLSNEWGIVTSAGLVGLSVSYAFSVTDALNMAVRQMSELETNIVSVERLKEYREVEQEAPWTVPDTKPPADWPQDGAIAFDGYATRYRPGLDLVIQEISASVKPGERVGIVGRTGAGKSSLTLALFRMIEPAEGRIVIDDVDIARIGLHDLRSNLTIIPQDPILFSGTLRFNLDPFGRYSDDELWTALEHSHLKDFASALADGLDHAITEGGENISVGQRQLVCLARALLRRSRILILDEATASVDLATDMVIQETIRREFAQSTVLTIAHRLNTIMDYDRVIVLDKGRICEMDSPQNLLLNRNSMFAGMVANTTANTST